MTVIQPVILAGGSGTRLWPVSRASYPKQLLPMLGEHTMLQQTVQRIAGLRTDCLAPMIICNDAHRFLAAEQMQHLDTAARIVVEPKGRNTAPAAALAALIAARDSGEESPLLLVMPADHVIADAAAFHKAVEQGVAHASDGKLVVFGIPPGRAETGYGYIRAGSAVDTASEVDEFVEKPDAQTAERYVSDGGYYWNSGMFLFTASAYIDELQTHAPAILEACRLSVAAAEEDGDLLRPGTDEFLDCPSDSIDYAIMEKTRSAVMVPLDAGWSDVGSWAALHDALARDADGNSVDGDVVQTGCSDTLIRAESRMVAAVGLTNAVIVETKDVVLVADKDSSQDVKALVDTLRAGDRPETELHRQVFRPWGSYDSIDSGDGFQVKRLIVKPGARLSLQKHARRAEHWTVVRGTARITLDDQVFDLTVNESTHIPIGAVHRIENPFDTPVHIIEVQCGDYLGEDDIVRIEDQYGRAGTTT